LSRLLPDRIARAGLLLVLMALLTLTWRKWGYLPVDVGREMYVPAAMAEGKRLYFDLWYVYGPLIPYWHALLFRMFGIHLGILLAAGVSIVGITATLVYSISRVFLPVWLSFAAVFAFLMQAFQLNIFNYVLPYSYPAAYGAMFSVFMVWLLLRYGYEPSLRYMVPAAFLACLMMLTKLEFGAMGYAVIGCALAIETIRTRSIRGLARGLAICIPGVVIWLGIYGWYVHAGGADFFLGENLSILPSSHFVQHFRTTWNEFTGLVLTPPALAITAAVGLSSFIILAGSIVLATRSRLARWLLPAMALLLCAVTVMLPHSQTASGLARFVFFNPGMAWIGVAVLSMAAAAWLRGERPAAQQSTIVLSTMAILSSLRVVTKIAPGGYSVFFDTLIYLVWLVGLFGVLKRFQVDLDGRAGKVLAGILCLSMVAMTFQNYPIGERPSKISSARGTLYAAAPFGDTFSQVLAFLKAAKQRSQRFVLLPEDTALYFFSDTTAPSRWYVVIPPDLPPGEATAKYIDELERANLRYVIVSNRATPEYGLPLFGVDYGQPIFTWLHQHYHVIQRIGDYEAVPYPREWGVLIYERR
jgi:hypothetical protein